MLLDFNEYNDLLEFYDFVNDIPLLEELFEEDSYLYEGIRDEFNKAANQMQAEKGYSDKRMKKVKRTAIGVGVASAAITVAGIGAIGYGLYKGIKGLVGLFKSLDKKIEAVKKQIANTDNPDKKAKLKEKLKQLEAKKAAAKAKIKDKKEKYKEKNKKG